MYNFLLAINMYGLMIGGGMLLCIALAYFMLKKKGYNSDIVFDVALICIPLAIVGARIYYIVFDILGGENTLKYWLTDWHFLGLVRENGSLRIRLQGLAIFGGLIFATLGTIFVIKLNKKNPKKDQMSFYQLVDIFYVFIILGQAIGRWGNYFNQEAFGNEVTNPSLQWFPYAVYIDKMGKYYQATFFYEFFFNTIGFFVLLKLYFGKKSSYDGFNFSIYCIWYGTVRALIEGLRSDSLMIGPFRASQILAIILVIYGLSNIAYHIYKAKKAGKKPFIYVDNSALSLEYYNYEKTIMFLNANEKQQASKSNFSYNQDDSGENK